MKWLIVVLGLMIGCVSSQVLNQIYPVGIDNASAYEILYEVHGGEEMLIAGSLPAGSGQLVQLPYGEYIVYVAYIGTGVMLQFDTEIGTGDYEDGNIPSFQFSSPEVEEGEIETYDL